MTALRTDQRRRRHSKVKGQAWLKWLCRPQTARFVIAVGRLIVEIVKIFRS